MRKVGPVGDWRRAKFGEKLKFGKLKAEIWEEWDGWDEWPEALFHMGDFRSQS